MQFLLFQRGPDNGGCTVLELWVFQVAKQLDCHVYSIDIQLYDLWADNVYQQISMTKK